MSMIDFLPALAVLTISLAYYLGFKAKVSAQAQRIELAKIGNKLLACDQISPSLREHIEFCLDHSFGMRTYLLLSLPFLPFVAIWFIHKYQFTDPLVDEMRGLSIYNQKLFRRFDKLDTQIFFANNPYLVRFAFLIVGISVVLAWSVLAIWRFMRSMAASMVEFPSYSDLLDLLERILGVAVLRLDEGIAHARSALVAHASPS